MSDLPTDFEARFAEALSEAFGDSEIPAGDVELIASQVLDSFGQLNLFLACETAFGSFWSTNTMVSFRELSTLDAIRAAVRRELWADDNR